jgi:butyrate kinase
VTLILAINPGSTSTKVAAFENETERFSEEVRHPKAEIIACGTAQGQLGLRRGAVAEIVARRLAGHHIPDAVVGRGGLLRPLCGGVYAVSPAMLSDLAANRFGEHPCNLGAPLALAFAEGYGCPALVVDPPVTDELREVARITGLPRIRRRSLFHALSQRAAARQAAALLGIAYESAKFVVAHMGGGVSVGAHHRGRIVEVTNGVDGEGPMSAERAGALPALTLLELVARGEDPVALRREVLTMGGLYAYAGTNDLRVIEERALAGDAAMATLIQTLAYSVAKNAGAVAAALFEDDAAPVDAVVLTGGMARSRMLVEAVERRTRWLGPVLVLPEVEEMRALADGARLALEGRQPMLEY